MKDLMQTLDELQPQFERARLEREAECESYWNNLSKADQEKAFYSVVKRIFEGDIDLGGSYRFVLYNVFKFDEGMYMEGMDCGYMTLHNMIFQAKELEAMSQVQRVEVVDENGHTYSRTLKDEEGVKFDLLDNDSTLRIRIDENSWKEGL